MARALPLSPGALSLIAICLDGSAWQSTQTPKANSPGSERLFPPPHFPVPSPTLAVLYLQGPQPRAHPSFPSTSCHMCLGFVNNPLSLPSLSLSYFSFHAHCRYQSSNTPSDNHNRSFSRHRPAGWMLRPSSTRRQSDLAGEEIWPHGLPTENTSARLPPI